MVEGSAMRINGCLVCLISNLHFLLHFAIKKGRLQLHQGLSVRVNATSKHCYYSHNLILTLHHILSFTVYYFLLL